MDSVYFFIFRFLFDIFFIYKMTKKFQWWMKMSDQIFCNFGTSMVHEKLVYGLLLGFFVVPLVCVILEATRIDSIWPMYGWSKTWWCIKNDFFFCCVVWIEINSSNISLLCIFIQTNVCQTFRFHPVHCYFNYNMVWRYLNDLPHNVI